jgi:hypothetical protein
MYDFSHPDDMGSDSRIAPIIGGISALGAVLLIVVPICIVIPIIVAMVSMEFMMKLIVLSI